MTPVSIAICLKPIDFRVASIKSIAVVEGYECLAPLSNRFLNYYPLLLTTTTGWITAELPMWFALIPGSRAWTCKWVLSHDVLCLAWQTWKVDLFLNSLALCRIPEQLKHIRFFRNTFFLASILTTLSQLTALWSGVWQNRQPRMFASWFLSSFFLRRVLCISLFDWQELPQPLSLNFRPLKLGS